MRNAETIHQAICKLGRKDVPLERVYRLLFNRDLYLAAYGRLYKNKGALPPGANGETVQGMSLDRIDRIIELLRYERYQWSPARRVEIPKKDGKKRPLGIPSWSDKMVQEVLRMVLESYYEPRFSERSHGFRPGRGPHTALREIYRNWQGTTWLIEGDIKGCFDNIDRKILLDTLRESIHDERLIRLISNMMEAGYMKDWVYGKTLSGTPQGGVISPLLANIYMDKLDKFVERQLRPAWNRKKVRRANSEYVTLRSRRDRISKRSGRNEQTKAISRMMRKLPSMDNHDADYRRLRYIRYADDFLLGFVGPKSEAEQIKKAIGVFLRDHLKLEMSEAKTLVTHAKTEKARFLGYEVCALTDNTQVTEGRRSINGKIGLRVPLATVDEKAKRYMGNGKPIHKNILIGNSDFDIVAQYQSVYRGIVGYWKMAYNLNAMSKLKFVMQTSMLKTLAAKHKTRCSAIRRKYQTYITVNGRKYKAYQVKVERPGKDPLVATWGGIPLTRDPEAPLNDQPKTFWNKRTELVQRLLADECEWCGDTGQIEVHHVRGLKDLKGKLPYQWLMAARRRKTMALCKECHQDATHGRPMRRKPSGAGFMQAPTGWHRKHAQT